MKKLKHSKFRNTGVLFELLVRQVASDTLNNTDSKALPIIKKYFAKSTELSKELELYETLSKEKFNSQDKAKSLLEVILKARAKLNNTTLKRQKYNLVKTISENYVIEDFFKSHVNNYKILASTYKLFEYNESDNPKDFVSSKYTLIEHVTNDKKETKKALVETVNKEQKDLRLLSYKILIDKFNAKYNGLNGKQKTMLKEYINNVSNTNGLRDYVETEVNIINKNIKSLSKKVHNKIIRIKLQEVANLLENISNANRLKDSHVLSILRYYELIKELKKLGDK